jgi:cysteine desulfurase / selenocysteine lyase
VELYGLTDPERAKERVGVIPFSVRGVDHYRVAAVLSYEGGIGVRNGCFCAHPYILRLLKVPESEALRHQQEIRDGVRSSLPGLVRISFGCYNTTEEIDHMAEVLARVAAGDLQVAYEQDAGSGAYWPRGYVPSYDDFFVLRPGLRPRFRGHNVQRCGV